MSSDSDLPGGFDSPIHPGFAAITLILSGLVLFLISGGAHQTDAWERALLDAALLLGIAGMIAGLLSIRFPRFSGWFIITVMVASIHLSASRLGQPRLLGFAAGSVLLAGILINARAAFFTATAETVLLWWSFDQGISGAEALDAIVPGVIMWCAVIVTFVLYRFFHQYDGWLGQQLDATRQAIGEARDDRLRLEENRLALAHANRQLLLANGRAVDLRTLAEAAEKAKTIFVSKVSHEFRTPLNMIIGLVGLIMDESHTSAGGLPPQLQSDLEVVYRNCQHLSRMINDVLSLSQIESGRLTLHREWVDLGMIVRDSTEVVRPLVDMKHLELEICIARDLPAVYCDRTRIQQVVLNLLSNAARFTEGGKVSVDVHQTDSRVRVTVADTGSGISPQDLERIFEPFAQGTDALWRDRGGSGLGLSISQQFVKLHGGRMWVESQLGVGSTFSFELPISAPMAVASSARGWVKQDWAWREGAFLVSQAALDDAPAKPRVVVCDETGGLVRELERFADVAEFATVEHWEQVLEELRQCPAHTLLVNTGSKEELWSMVETARQDVPDTLITGCCFPRSNPRNLVVDAVDYLVKPVSPQDLERAIRKVPHPVRRVLVVDDDQELQDLIVRMLKSCDSELVIDTASTGEQALDHLRQGTVDLMLLDIILPDMNGRQIIEWKEADGAIKDVPVVIVSALDPSDHETTSGVLVTAEGSGFPVRQVLRCSLGMAELLSSPSGSPR